MPRFSLHLRHGTSLGWLLLGACCFLVACNKSATPSSSAADPAKDWFADVTVPSRLQFQHVTGTNYFMPDQVGSGVALIDYDNDGRLDVYFLQNGGPNSGVRNQLFHQETNGTFRNVSDGSGLDVAGRGMGAWAGDVNNDGLPDMLVTEYGAIRLFQNVGQGKFRQVTAEAGLDNPRWAAPASHENGSISTPDTRFETTATFVGLYRKIAGGSAFKVSSASRQKPFDPPGSVASDARANKESKIRL